MNKGAVTYVAKLLIQRALGLLLYLLGAWGTMGLRAWVYFATYFAVGIVSSVIMYRVNPVTLAERNKIDAETPAWDKALLSIFWPLSFFVIYLVAGLEAAKAPPPGTAFWLGMALQLPIAALTLWALIVNTYFESSARIQIDREQTICKEGPYRFIRHPGYAAIVVWCVAVVMVFGTPGVALTAAAIAGIILIRTHLEDEMLHAFLPGYIEYAREVRYRIVPFVW